MYNLLNDNHFMVGHTFSLRNGYQFKYVYTIYSSFEVLKIFKILKFKKKILKREYLAI